MKVLITGAGGFLGQHFISYLSDKDCEIHNLGVKQVKNSAHFLLKDIKNKKLINSAISKIRPDYLLHLAGTTDTSDIKNCYAVNTYFGSCLLEALSNADLDSHTKVVIVGSASEYGVVSKKQLPIKENTPPKPNNLYGKSKLTQTKMALSWQKPKRPLLVVRPFNIIGPGIPNHFAIGSFFQQIQSIPDKGILKVGNLNTSRDFINVFDVVQLIWRLINDENSYGQVVNLCRGKSVPIIDIVEYMLENSGKEIELIIEKERIRKNDMKFHYGDNTKLLNLVGDFKFTSWSKTLKQTIKTQSQ